MKSVLYFYSLSMFVFLISTTVLGQGLQPPPMYYVTVDPETGNDVIRWNTSPSPQIDYYIIGIRVVTLPGEPDSYLPIGMIPAPDSAWTNINPESASHSVGYAVWGVDDQGGGVTFTGPYDRTDSTMFLQSAFDSCNAAITLNWNDYNSWRGSTAIYNVYRRLGAGVYLLLGSVPYGINTYIVSNVQINTTYELFVEAVNVDGIRRSTSNRISVFTQMSQQPGFINADYATISAGNTIDLSFTVDTASELTHYYLFRSATTVGPFDQIASINTNSFHITYTDDIPFQSGIFYYRLDAINSCNTASARSNLANNIILTGAISGSNIAILWNDYTDWVGGVDNYRIIRYVGRTDPQIDTLDAGKLTNYTDNVSGMTDYANPVSSYICYKIEAVERMNMHGIRGRSMSNRVCFSLTPNIRMPNAFIPNDPQVVNQVFEPVFSFLPEHYQLIIYNRLGTKLWEGTGAWDGKVAGKLVPEGVYLYLLRVYNYSTDITEINGSVTLIYR
jgi:hypothetical protein